MILYRALTDEDFEEFKKSKKISCTLARTYSDLENAKNIKMTKKNYNICYVSKNEKDILSFIYGHVKGVLVSSAKRSPWISLTSNYDVAIKYANLSTETKRRNILCVKINDKEIINCSNDFETKKITDGGIINLSTGQLAKYRDENIIIPYGANSKKKRKSKNFLHNAYCIGDRHYVICYELKPEKYIVLSPKQQDNLSQIIETKLENKKNNQKQLVKKLK